MTLRSIPPESAERQQPARLASAAFLGLPITLTVAAGAGYLLLLAGGPSWLPWLGVAPSVLLGLQAIRGDATPGGRAVLLVIAAGLAWAFAVFGIGEVLPQRTLLEAFPPGSSGHAYPPGYPTILAPIGALGPTGALVAFKLITVLAVGLIPAAWGWMHWSLFSRETPLWLTIAVAYVAFVVIERQLGFLTAFAGKNAVQFALLLFPAVVVATIRGGRRPWTWGFAAASLFGLFLIHYSMAYLAAFFLAAHVLVGGDWRRLPVLRMAVAGAIAVGLVAAVLGPALDDPRVAAGPWSPARALAELGRQAFALKPNLVVFHDASFGLVPAPFRLLAVAASAAFAVAVGLRTAEPTHWRPAAVYGLAFLASLAAGYGVLPLGLSVDFMRCYAWALQAALFLTAGLAVVRIWPTLRFPARTPAAAAIGLGVALIVARDLQVEHRVFARRVLDAAELAEIVRALPSRGPCFMITPGTARPEALVTEQELVAWNYAEAVSPCTFLTGSWVQPGPTGGRALSGLPSGEVLRSLPVDAAVLFIGDPTRLRAYDDALRSEGRPRAWRLLDPEAGGGAVWQALPQRSPSS